MRISDWSSDVCSSDLITDDASGEQSLKGAKGAAFAKKMKATATHNEKIARTAAPNGKPPKFRPLQLATLVDAVPSGNDWFHEIKYDGYRALVAAAGRAVVVYTRSGLDWTDKFAPPAERIA